MKVCHASDNVCSLWYKNSERKHNRFWWMDWTNPYWKHICYTSVLGELLAAQSDAHRGGTYRDFHPTHPTYGSGAGKPRYMRVTKSFKICKINAIRLFFRKYFCGTLGAGRAGTTRYRVLKRHIMSYIFNKQALRGYQIWYWEGPLGDYLETTWRLIEDYLKTTWRLLGDILETSWRLLRDSDILLHFKKFYDILNIFYYFTKFYDIYNILKHLQHFWHFTFNT